MRVEIREAETSAPGRRLWVWRVWSNGRVAQGFSKTEKAAQAQAKIEQSRLENRWRGVTRFTG